MNDGILLPFRFQVHDFQAFEKVFPTLKIGVQGGRQKTLAEPTRTTEEDILHSCHLPHKVGFVDVNIVTFPDFGEGLDADGIFA